MNELDKLRVLLPHWIAHNQEHAADYVRWADVAWAGGEDAAAGHIRAAIAHAAQANEALRAALDELGGALPGEGHDHAH
jgi:hypothetical protein